MKNIFRRKKQQSPPNPLPGTGLHFLNTDKLTNRYTDSVNIQQLHAWKELYIYRPQNQPELHQPNNDIDPSTGKKWMYLIHMFRDPSKIRQEFFTTPFKNLLKTWDVISTSLVSNQNSRAAVGYFGFILDVPISNILSTNYKDIGFQNHVGVEWVKDEQGVLKPKVIKPYDLVDHINELTNRIIQSPSYILSRTDKMPAHIEDVMRLKKEFPTKTFPAHFLASFSTYNEIVIVGKPHVHIHPQGGIPPTGYIGVKGLYVMDNPQCQRYYHLVQQLAMINKVPIIYVDNPSNLFSGPGQKIIS